MENMDLALKETEQPVQAGSVELAGKFKNGEQLEQAYKELEAEFTRRSQRLNQLTRDNEQLQSRLEIDAADSSEDMEPQEAFSAAVSSFLNDYPLAANFANEIADIVQAEEGLQNEHGLLAAYAKVITRSYKTPHQLLADQQFVKEHVLSNEGIRTAFLQDYICALNRGDSPVVMNNQYSGLLPITPKSAPSTLEEAGELAKTIL